MSTSVVSHIQTQRNGKDRKTVTRVRPDWRERDDLLVHEQIAQLAYSHWQSRGCPLGSAEEDWLRAERDIQERQRLRAGAA